MSGNQTENAGCLRRLRLYVFVLLSLRNGVSSGHDFSCQFYMSLENRVLLDFCVHDFNDWVRRWHILNSHEAYGLARLGCFRKCINGAL